MHCALTAWWGERERERLKILFIIIYLHCDCVRIQHFPLFVFCLHFRLHFWSTMRSRWLAASLRLFLLCKLVNSMPSINSTLKINPKPCTANGYGGTCMFVWECIKSEGQHVGMCVDSFMFGSCCAYNVTEHLVLTSHPHFDFKPPIRKPRPPNANTQSHRPNQRWTLVFSLSLSL